MKSITNRNDKGLLHGYQEWYFGNGKSEYKAFFNNGIVIDYLEWHGSNYKLWGKSFYI